MTASDNPSLDELADADLDTVDDAVLARMAEVYTALDPMPGGLVERIRFGITLDALTAEIAELQRTSELTGVRSSGSEHTTTVTFTSSSVTIMITVSVLSSARARIDGWAAPGGGVVVTARTSEGDDLTATADADGRFVFADLPRGLVQLTVRQPGDGPSKPVITPSIEI